MALRFKSMTSSVGARTPLDTVRKQVVNRSGGATVVGGVYALDTRRTNANTTSQARAWTTLVALDASYVTYGHPVIAEEARAAGAVVSCVMSGPAKANCYGALALGDPLALDSTNARFVKATDLLTTRAIFDGPAQTATNALNLCDVILCGNPVM